MRYRPAALSAACLVCALVQTAPAQEPAQAAPDDWRVRCEAQGCLVVKPAVAANGKRLVSLTFAVGADTGTVRMALMTPLGTALGPGLRVAYGTDEETYQFTTCMSDGCLVVVDLTPAEVENMQVQPALELTFMAVNAEQPFTVSIPLDEMGEAISAARQNAAR